MTFTSDKSNHQLIREPFWKVRDLYSRVFFCAQRFIFARYSEKLAIYIRTCFFERSVFWSLDNLKMSRFLFARLPLCATVTFSICETFCKLAISIRAPFFERSVFYSRDNLKRSRSLFARLPSWTAFFIRESFWKTYNLYLRALLWAQRLVFARQCKKSRSLFARLPLCAAFPIRESCWKFRNLYSCAFLWAQRFQFARQSEHSQSVFARWGVHM